MQILWLFAFLLSEAGDPPSDFRPHKKEQNREVTNISNQPIIFNITYTPWKVKSNATAEERAKFERERPYYEMSDSGNNIYKYMTSDRKLNGENSKTETRSLINYFKKSTGVFNGNGVITQEQLKAIQQRAHAPKNIWHGFISLNKEMSYKIDTPEKCMWLIKRTFGEFFKDMGLDPKNIDLICALHKDKPHHLHIHFWFAEKEPKCKYRKKQTEYRHKGKIEKRVLDRMHVRLNMDIMESHPKLYVSRDEALRELKKISALRDIITKDDIKEAVLELAKTIPKVCSFHYGSKDMIPYREQINRVVNKLYDIISDEEKKELIATLVKEIQIYPEGESDTPLKSMKFNFPVYKDGQEVNEIFLDKQTNVETLVTLSYRNGKAHLAGGADKNFVSGEK